MQCFLSIHASSSFDNQRYLRKKEKKGEKMSCVEWSLLLVLKKRKNNGVNDEVHRL